MKRDFTTVLQLTDLHLFADQDGEFNHVNTQESYYKVLNHIRQHYETPDIIIITGDLAHDGKLETYQFIANSLKIFSSCVFYVLGNHDNPENVNKTYPLSNISSDTHCLLEHWQIILVDSNHCRNQDNYEGEISPTELSRIENLVVSYPLKWTLIAMHHNVPDHQDRGINIELRNHQQVMQHFERLQNIKLVLSGHVHQDFTINQHGICYFSTPSTGFQSLSKSGQVTSDAPGYRWLKLYNNGRFETDVRRINVWAS